MQFSTASDDPILNESAILAEQDFIGAILVNNDALALAEGIAQPHHFSIDAHRRIFEEVLAVIGAGQIANPFTLEPRLQDVDLSTQGGARAYCWRVAQSCAIVHMPDLAELIRSNHLRREFQKLCMSMAAKATEQASIEEVMAEAGQTITGLLSGGLAAGMHDNYQVGEQIIADMQSGKEPYSTGLSRLDLAMDGGLMPGRSYGFVARKKYGKTAIAATISHNLSQNGVKHLFICGEMSPKEIQRRVLARVLQVYPSRFRKDRTTAFQNRVGAAVATLKRNTVYKNAPGLTFDALQQIVATAIVKHKISGFILDYWQLVGGKRKGQSTSEHLDEVAQWIADTSRKYDIWSITMGQMNQEGNTRGGEGIRMAFDQIYELCRENVETSPLAWLTMIETRDTAWRGVGNEQQPGLVMEHFGPYFRQLEDPNPQPQEDAADYILIGVIIGLLFMISVDISHIADHLDTIATHLTNK